MKIRCSKGNPNYTQEKLFFIMGVFKHQNKLPEIQWNLLIKHIQNLTGQEAGLTSTLDPNFTLALLRKGSEQMTSQDLFQS